MKKVILVSLVIITTYTTGLAQQTPYGHNSNTGKHVTLNGINVYYEVYGSGPPLVLLHGNGGSIAGRANLIPHLSEKFKVIAIDSRCHGKSGCSKELNYEMMASDVNGLLNHLKIDSAFVYGHSDGGIVGLILAYTYPNKVKRLVASGANVLPDKTALEPVIVDIMKNYKVLQDTLMQKHFKLMVDHPNLDFAELAKIKIPVMIMSGDRDAVILEHTIKIFRAIPNSNLCILPGTSHFINSEKPDQLLHWLNEFFLKKFSKPSTAEYALKAAQQMGLTDKK